MQEYVVNEKLKEPTSFLNIVSRNRTFLKWMAKDLVRLKGMRLLSCYKLMLSYLFRVIDKRKSLAHLMVAHRYCPTAHLGALFLRQKEFFLKNLDSFVYHAGPEDFRESAARSIILKMPSWSGGKIEKGVLLITFTESFSFYHTYVDCERLLQYFYVVLEPSWAGYCNPNILFWLKYRSHEIVLQSSEQRDYSFVASLAGNLIPVDFGASDWVDYRVFYPLPEVKKEYDAIYVCTYKPIKRHHVLFKALRDLQDPTYKAALLCVSWGGTRKDIENLIDHYGVRENITLYENCPPTQINELLNRSKVNILLSLKEGSNRSIFEGFFADVPCIVLKNNIGVNKNYINSITGALIAEDALPQTLLYFRTDWHRYAPREWAMKNIAPAVTTKKLSACLQRIAGAKQEPWTRDLVPKVNVPEVHYLFPPENGRGPDMKRVLGLFFKGDCSKELKPETMIDAIEKLCPSLGRGNGPVPPAKKDEAA